MKILIAIVIWVGVWFLADKINPPKENWLFSAQFWREIFIMAAASVMSTWLSCHE